MTEAFPIASSLKGSGLEPHPAAVGPGATAAITPVRNLFMRFGPENYPDFRRFWPESIETVLGPAFGRSQPANALPEPLESGVRVGTRWHMPMRTTVHSPAHRAGSTRRILEVARSADALFVSGMLRKGTCRIVNAANTKVFVLPRQASILRSQPFVKEPPGPVPLLTL
jgi:hypothetical protein